MGTYDEPCFEETHQISHFDIQNYILTFRFGPYVAFLPSQSYVDIRLGPNSELLHSKSYFNIRIRAEYHYVNVSVLIKFSQKTSVLP